MDKLVFVNGQLMPIMKAYGMLFQEQMIYEQSEGKFRCSWNPFARDLGGYLRCGNRRVRHRVRVPEPYGRIELRKQEV